MLTKSRALLGALLLTALGFELVACAGKSDGEKSSSGKSGSAGTGGSGDGGGGSGASAGSGTGGSSGSSATGCEYNGVRYEFGETFGSCDNCSCTPTGGVVCSGTACAPAGGAMNGGGGGVAASGGATGGGGDAGSTTGGGMSFGGAGLGGSAGNGGNAGMGLGGDLGGGGSSAVVEKCDFQMAELCIVGTPRGGGHELVEGMPAVFSVRADGCLSSSCTELVSVDCNYIGDPYDFYVNAFFCANVGGGGCTRDCGGTPESTCDVGMTLAAGEYTVRVSSGSAVLRFTIPGVIAEEDRCIHPAVP